MLKAEKGMFAPVLNRLSGMSRRRMGECLQSSVILDLDTR
jgi:hypothetical protein